MSKYVKCFLCRFFLCIILLGVTENGICYSSEDAVSEKLKKIPKEDQEKLEKLFRILFVEHLFGYTLFGDKPVTLQGFQFSPIWCELTCTNPNIILIREGIEAWKLYQHLFPSQNYILKIRDHKIKGALYQEVFLINLKKTQHILTEYPRAFPFFSKSTLESVEKIFPLHDDSIGLQSSDTASGILFGFGEKNAQQYARETNLCRCLAYLCQFPRRHEDEWKGLSHGLKEAILYFQNKKSLPSNKQTDASLKEMIKEYEEMQKNRQGLGDIYPTGPLTLISLPRFVANPHFPETKELHASYSKTQKELMAMMQSPNFLKIVLTKYVEGI